MLVSGLYTRYIDLFPLHRHIVGFKDGLDRFRHFGTNTVTCIERKYLDVFVVKLGSDEVHTRNQRNSVLAAVLCRFEDIGLDRSHSFTGRQ
jgi:hypothetical protein